MNLLVAAVLLLQDKAAEETFEMIEEQIEKAKTVRITSKLEGTLNDGKEKTISKTGLFILKQGKLGGSATISPPVLPKCCGSQLACAPRGHSMTRLLAA